MAELKLFHKILIVIALLIGLSKLSKTTGLSKENIKTITQRVIQTRKDYEGRESKKKPERIVERVVVREPVVVKPEQVIVREYIPSPESSSSTPRCAVVIGDSGVTPCETIHMDDTAIRRYYGR